MNFSKIKSGWGDDSDDDPDFLKLDTSQSISETPKKLYERKINYRNENPKIKFTDKDSVCNPTKKSDERLIRKTENSVFHLDNLNRPIIIASSLKHTDCFFKLEDNDKLLLLNDIHIFCKSYKINDYSISWENNKNSNHFHIKIKLNKNDFNKIKK